MHFSEAYIQSLGKQKKHTKNNVKKCAWMVCIDSNETKSI